MGEPLLPITAEISIDASVEKVWDTMTGVTTAPAWLGAMDYTGAVGSTFFMQQDPDKKSAHDTDGATWCEIRLMQKPHKMDFSWYLPGTPETNVQISIFSEGPGKSFVRLIHDDWDAFEREAIEDFYDQIATGWQNDVLPGLKELAEAR